MDVVRRQLLLALRALAIANAGERIDDDWAAFEDACDVVVVAAKDVLIPANAQHRYAYLFAQGLAKIVRTGDHPSTLAFIDEGQILALDAVFPPSRLQRSLGLRIVPGMELVDGDPASFPLEVVTLEQLTALRIDLALVNELAETRPAWNHLRELTLRAQLAFFTGVAVDLRNGSAENRYQRLLGSRPDLVRRLSQREIAQYLDISPVTLSRLTAKLRARHSTAPANGD